MKTKMTLAMLVLFSLLKAATLQAAVPELLNFQGRLCDPAGTPITAQRPMVFTLYDAEASGSAVYSETQSVTPDANGIYTVVLGKLSPFAGVNFNAPLWLEVIVDGETMAPRYEMTTAPYSFRAAVANSVAWTDISGVPAGFADGIDDVGVGGGSIDASTVTLQGNVFNTANRLVRLNNVGRIPANLIDTTVNSSTTFNASIGTAIRTINGNVTLTDQDHVILVDAALGIVTIGLPPASSAKGRSYVIKKKLLSLNLVVIDGFGTETIDGLLTYVLAGSASLLGSITVISDGAAWYSLASAL